MRSKIRVLSEETINQIAAGEVVENPASVVKELVENAIDAGSRKILIEIKGGGHLFISVSDDGSGMGEDDAILSLERHATSKIVKAADLSYLQSMGFRGEALASISAISKMRVLTSLDGEIATELECHGGKLFSPKAGVRGKGTTVEVSSLFYNTPARKKFQKDQARSTADIVKMVTQLTLAHKEVSFELRSGERGLIKTSDLPDRRVEEVLGREFVEGMRRVDYGENGHVITGLVGDPENTRQNRSGQFLFINRRPVHSLFVSDAVKGAYGTMIGTRAFPIYLLWVQLPTELIDVNVHPQKRAVRFQDEEGVQRILHSAVRKALANTFEAPKPKIFPSFKREVFQEPVATYEPLIISPKIEKKIEKKVDLLGFVDHFAIAILEKEHPLFGKEETASRLLLLNLQQIQKRIAFEEMLERLSNEKVGEMQRLLFPETLSFTPSEVEVILGKITLIRKMGIDLRLSREGTFLLEALSPLFTFETIKEFIYKLIDEIRIEVNFERLARLATSHIGKKVYTKGEAESLLEKLVLCKDPQFGPKGKRTYLTLEGHEIGQLLIKR
jgi:DNA mismatch repair protein MutL